MPRAFDYYDFFSSLPPEAGDGWQQVAALAGAARGDLIAWRFPQIEPGHDTGHVVFVASTPAPAAQEPLGYELAAVAGEGSFEPGELVPGVPEESTGPSDQSD